MSHMDHMSHMIHMMWLRWENPSQDDDGDCFLNRIEVINISRFNGTPITRNKTSKTTTTILVTGIFAASNVSNVSKSSKSEPGINVPEASVQDQAVRSVPSTKKNWKILDFKSRAGPDKDQKILRNQRPTRTRTKEIWKSRTGPEPMAVHGSLVWTLWRVFTKE